MTINDKMLMYLLENVGIVAIVPLIECFGKKIPTRRYIKEEEFEDTKGAIRIRISKKNRQHNDQKKKYKRTNNDLQNIHIKLKIE